MAHACNQAICALQVVCIMLRHAYLVPWRCMHLLSHLARYGLNPCAGTGKESHFSFQCIAACSRKCTSKYLLKRETSLLLGLSTSA